MWILFTPHVCVCKIKFIYKCVYIYIYICKIISRKYFHAHTHIYICICVRGLIIIVVRIGTEVLSSNPGCISLNAKRLGKCMHPTILSPAIGK